MVQTKYRMLLGTSKEQWEELAVMDDGRMMLYFHGRGRSVTQQVTAITEGEWAGWLRSEKGSLWPGLESGRWNKMDDVRWKMEDVVETTEHAEPEVVAEPQPTVKSEEQEPLTINPALGSAALPSKEPLTLNQPHPRRQHKPRKPRVERQTSSIEHQPIPADAPTRSLSDIGHQTSATLKAVGMVAAATVALFVIYETGLLIPLGLIGLATGGILK